MAMKTLRLPLVLFCVVLAALIGLCAYILYLHAAPEPDAPVVAGATDTAPAGTPKVPQDTPAPTATPALVPALDATPAQDRQFAFVSSPFWLDGVLSSASSYRSPTLFVNVKTVVDTKHFDKRVTYYVAEIFVSDVTEIRTESFQSDFSKKGKGDVAKMAKRSDALVAISGDYYGFHSDTLVIRNGTAYRKSLAKYGDVCLLLRDGTMETIRRNDAKLNDILERDPWQAWQFGPALLGENGAVRKSFPDSTLNQKNPRCCIGYVEPGHYFFVVVDGRQKHSSGMTLAELSELMHSLGCVQAFNLDGGASAHFYWNDRIFNQPSKGGRSISDIIYIAKEGYPASLFFHGKDRNPA